MAVATPLLCKTFELVDDPSTDEIVSWGEDQKTSSSFVVWKPKELANHLLPNYFKHNNLSSFVRQLNTYGFRKVTAKRWEYANDLFRKGEKHLLSKIQRRIPKSSSSFTLPICEGSSFTSTLVQEKLCPTGGSPSPANTTEPHYHHCYACSTSTNSGQHAAAMSLCEENELLRTQNGLLLKVLIQYHKKYAHVLSLVQQNLPSHEFHRFGFLSTVNNDSRSQQQYSPVNFNIPQQMTEIEESGRADELSWKADFGVEHKKSAEDATSPARLFGVPLHGMKRRHPGFTHSIGRVRVESRCQLPA